MSFRGTQTYSRKSFTLNETTRFLDENEKPVEGLISEGKLDAEALRDFFTVDKKVLF